MQERVPKIVDLESGLAGSQGLTEAAARTRLIGEGPNELPTTKPRRLWETAWEILSEPMFLLLVATGLLYLVLGDLQESLALLSAILIVIGITLYQERRAERALEALRDLSSPRALVVRDGRERRISGREVVRGDFVILAEGDRVPADALVLSCVNLTADESLLTGESVPVRKAAATGMTETMARAGGDDLPFVYSGTLIVQGRGAARVLATGTATELGRIGKALHTLTPEKTPLQKQTGRLVRLFAVLALSLCVIATIAYGLSRDNWPQAILVGLTMAMSMVPEEMPVVLTIFLALGAWRISRKAVLTRRIPAIESLGAATVLCVDKTGTLTQNRMSVSELFTQGESFVVDGNRNLPFSDPFSNLVTQAVLASQREPVDPMEKAIQQLAARALPNLEQLQRFTLEKEYSLTARLFAVTRVWQEPASLSRRVAAKGAPEAVAELCRLGPDETKVLNQLVTEMASRGLRVLGVAEGRWTDSELPELPSQFTFQFLGLIGLADPIREAVPAAIRECQTAGIRVVMITGDYPATAQSIARQISLLHPEDYVTGNQLQVMHETVLRERIKAVNIFARTAPEQKLRLVQALQANGEVVAMTGDGVNDAPALRAANIGVAMGGRGTDVARESAALVLLEDDFSSLVAAVRLGRRIYDNIRKAMSYIVAIHVPIAGMSLLPVLFRWPLVLLPLHIVFLELIIDPACSTAFEAEPEEENIMNRPPRDPAQPLFSLRTILLNLLQGTGAFVAVFLVFVIALKRGQGELDARALSFTTLILANLGLIWTNRSSSKTALESLFVKNLALWFITAGALTFLAMVLYVPLLRRLFGFSILHPIDLGICFGAALISVLWFDLSKIARRNSHRM